jgi:hypothetical protein
MKAKRIFLLIVLISVFSYAKSISLQGIWRFALDPNDIGLRQKWQNKLLSERIRMPGSLQAQGFGNHIDENTPWTGNARMKEWNSLFPQYTKSWINGNLKVPCWLNPDRYYIGVAWYQHDFDVTKGQGVMELELERVHWGSTVFVDSMKIGQQNSLSVPHRYILRGLKTGRHVLTIRVDNRMLVDVGINGHSVTDHTQTNWNGFIGNIEMEDATTFIDHAVIVPDISKKSIWVQMSFMDEAKKKFMAVLQVKDMSGKIIGHPVSLKISKGQKDVDTNISLGQEAQLWSEFNPAVYRLEVSCNGTSDARAFYFGLREFKAKGTHFEVNGTPIMLRGTLNCCEFPLTGYPSMDHSYWAKIYNTCKEYGLNHVRFHSWCPPEVAFEEADKAGIYLLVECTGWTNVGSGKSQDKWFYDESERIVKEYGNHPSFCMMAYGNEPNGENMKEYLQNFVSFWKSKDNRRVYTGASGWPYLSNADYESSSSARIQRWGEGLKSIINAQSPNSIYDWSKMIRKNMPTVSHEVGQWCVYPDFKEIDKYTGFLKAYNLEMFRDGLAARGMDNLSEKFLYASGRLQTLCYKADIEAALRTKEFAGFQILSLQDFPGQGTALVGVLNDFWENKGYVHSEEFREFCNQLVPLVRFPKMVWLNNEKINAPVEIANYSGCALPDAKIAWTISDETKRLAQGEVQQNIAIGNCIPAGTILYDCSSIQEPTQLGVDVYVKGTQYHNHWNLWVYPAEKKAVKMPYITDQWNAETDRHLQKGENVLLLTRGKILPEKGGKVKVGFSSIFWNTPWTTGQPPYTLGILCNPKSPILAGFPNQGYSDYQWWDIMSASDAMIMDDMPKDFLPDIQMIDDWTANHKLGLLFETKVGKGKLVVCSIDLTNNLTKRPAAAQLRQSILEYMASANFHPTVEIDSQLIKRMITK